jgi:putative NIF3 family GTP cyclohydrolase 1 type 2
MPEQQPHSETRRDFLTRGAAALMAAGALRAPAAHAREAPGTLTVQDVIDRILSAVPPGPAETVDTVKAGDPRQPVTGIVTTFLASCEVIDRAISLGANLLITHEPTFYNHLDRVDWLEKDDVYVHKLKLLQDSGMVVWRFHDGIHRLEPDGVVTGVLESLGWKDLARPDDPRVCDIPPMSLAELATIFRERLGTMRVLAVGDPRQRYRTVGLMVGAAGGESQMRFARETGVEVLVVGELAEWETSEYVRDATHAGLSRAALVVGHAASEEPGMKWLAEWLRPRFPGVTVTHVPLRDAIRPL